MNEPKEKGEAGDSLELKGGIISVRHHEGNFLLMSWTANEGDWDKIWELFHKLENDSESK
jgi:hypothetical protein